MAGTLTISTLSDGTNSTSATNCIQGSAKAWVNFNGTNSSIRASYNVSSITANATSDFTVNFTNAFADANYAVCGVGYHLENSTEGPTVVFQGFQAAGSVRVQYRGNGGSPNPQTMQFAMFR